MDKQIDRLKESDWQLLVVLDACRADYFRELAPESEVVESAGAHTNLWLKEGASWIAQQKHVYFTAMPQVTVKNAKWGLGLNTVDLWKRHWGHWTEQRIPSVHPQTVTAVVLEALQGIDDDCRIVAHYLQPHAPYIGYHPFWGVLELHGDNKEARQKRDPDAMRTLARTGKLNWWKLKQAYWANLRRAWASVRNLIDNTDRRVVVTGDHGEALGEGGRVWHNSQWTDPEKYPECYRVPWLEIDGGKRESSRVQQRLRELGYL